MDTTQLDEYNRSLRGKQVVGTIAIPADGTGEIRAVEGRLDACIPVGTAGTYIVAIGDGHGDGKIHAIDPAIDLVALQEKEG